MEPHPDFIITADPDPRTVRVHINSVRALRYALAINMPLGHPFGTRLAAATADAFVSDLVSAGLSYAIRLNRNQLH